MNASTCAKPETKYEVYREFEEPLLGVLPPWLPLDTYFSVQTDKNGNGNCTCKLPLEQLEALRGITTLHVKFVFIVGGIRVDLGPGTSTVVGGVVVFETEPTEIHLDWDW